MFLTVSTFTNVKGTTWCVLFVLFVLFLFVKAWSLGSCFLIVRYDETDNRTLLKTNDRGSKSHTVFHREDGGGPRRCTHWRGSSLPPLSFFLIFPSVASSCTPVVQVHSFWSCGRQRRSVLFPIFLRRRQNLGVTGPTLCPMPMKGKEKECVWSFCDSRPSPPYSMDYLNGLGYVPHDSLAFTLRVSFSVTLYIASKSF